MNKTVTDSCPCGAQSLVDGSHLGETGVNFGAGGKETVNTGGWGAAGGHREVWEISKLGYSSQQHIFLEGQFLFKTNFMIRKY